MLDGTNTPQSLSIRPHRKFFPASGTMATITKRELAINITNKLGAKGIELTQQDVLEVVQTLIDEVTDSLAKGDSVVMRNFGAFQVREMKAKIGRNPKNPGKDVPIPARAVVKFKPGKEMKEKVATTLQVIREQNS
ncbi:MAG: HU family DNA-binding protein [Akkermansiaceae bacterium]|nr:HU family DNA-binding protein [Akkermansiaceae bacterium]